MPVLALVAMAAATAPVAIEVGADPADAACPTRAGVVQALALRLGASPGANRTPAWRLRYKVGASPGAPGEWDVAIALVTPSGQPTLRRQLRIGTADCGPGAEAVAVVVEEYFRGVGWTRGQPLPAGTPQAQTTEVHAQPAVVPPLRSAPGPGLVLAVGVAGGIDDGTWARPRLSARVRLLGPVHLGVAADLPPRRRTEPVGGGDARLSSWPLGLSIPLVYRRPRLELEAGPALAVTLDFAQSRGITRAASQSRTTLAIGAGAGIAVPLAARWRLQAGIAGHRAVLGSDLVVNQTTVVLAIPRCTGLVFIAVGWEIF